MSTVHALEALLFVADAPVSLTTLSESLGVPEGVIEQGLEVLGARLSQSGAIQLVRIAGGYQLCTKPEFAETVSRFLRPQKQRLGKSLLEVLAIVAYRQPITTAEIDHVRGVQSDYSLRALLERRLVREVGRKSTPGRPVLYGTTQQFLHLFGLNELSELPDIGTEMLASEAQPALI